MLASTNISLYSPFSLRMACTSFIYGFIKLFFMYGLSYANNSIPYCYIQHKTNLENRFPCLAALVGYAESKVSIPRGTHLSIDSKSPIPKN